MKKIPEYWTKLPGTEKYEISNYGNFRRILKSGKARPIKTYIRKNKWMVVKVEFNGQYKEYYVHHLVAATFLEPPEEGQILYHKNLLIRDNYAGNLAWIDPKELGKITGKKTSRCIPVVQIDPNTNQTINFYNSITAAARDNYIHRETISQVIRGRLKTAAGYRWERETIDQAI